MRSGFIKTTVILFTMIAAGVTAASVYFGSQSDDSIFEGALTGEVFEGEFIASINESGDVESASNFEIRCKVKSRGRAGTTILKIAREGSRVKKGEFLVQLDDSELVDLEVQQKIDVAREEAALIQANKDLEAARQALKEFEGGLADQELDTLLAEVALAEETLRRARDKYKHTQVLSRKGYVTNTQLEADRFAVEKAKKDLDLAESQLKVFTDFTRSKTKTELEAEIKKQEAFKNAAEFTLQLAEQRLNFYQEQVASCRIVAPQDGQVVYANESDRRGNSSAVIEEGVMIRDGQPIIRLPDPSNMQVIVKVNDSKINSVAKGQKALIRLDSDPENPIEGLVRSKAAFPLPRRWYQAPIEYEVFVDVVEKDEEVLPGLRAKVEIFVERLESVVQAPVSALIQNEAGEYFVLKMSDENVVPTQVQIGPNNEQHVVIESGIKPGDVVLIDPDSYLDAVVLP